MSPRRAPSSSFADTASLTQLAPDIFVHSGAINVTILRHGDRAVLIDYGDGDVADSLRALSVRGIEMVLLTHYHRDQASGLAGGDEGTPSEHQLFVPALERAYVEAVERVWADPARRWHVYDTRPHSLLLPTSLRVHGVCCEPDVIDWGPWHIRVLDTPGHTDGSVSYLIERDGQRWACTGDVIAGPGQIWDAYSLQHGGTIGDVTIRDYHGFLGARATLIASLQKLRRAQPLILIPSHGVVIDRPEEAIAAVITNLGACYEHYAAISALRSYFPGVFAEYTDQTAWMPIGSGLPIPDFVRHIGTTWMLVADDGAALVMDCGSTSTLDEIRRMHASGVLRTVDAFWISHYHDDHVDAAPAFQEAFRCQTIADKTVAAVITHPWAHRLPCLSPAVVRLDRVTQSGESWDWHEFRLTAFHFPGQTHYHGALLAEGRGRRLFFIGDSFTMAGIDDYCMGNRNFLGANQGFDACLALVEALQPDALFNCHVDAAFAFTPGQLRRMRENLAAREELFGRLFAWDHANYGIDEHWVRTDPYEQEARAGALVTIRAVITNHSSVAHEAICRPVPPRGWPVAAPLHAGIPARTEAALPLRVAIPNDAPGGLYVVPISVDYGGKRLGPFREAIVRVATSS